MYNIEAFYVIILLLCIKEHRFKVKLPWLPTPEDEKQTYFQQFLSVFYQIFCVLMHKNTKKSLVTEINGQSHFTVTAELMWIMSELCQRRCGKITDVIRR